MNGRIQTAHDACDTQAAADLFRALAHPVRLQILCRLLDGEVSVAGLESQLGLKQPSLSQQLGILRDANLVTTRREAKSIFYSLTDRRIRAVMDALREALNEPPQPKIQAAIVQAAVRPAFRAESAMPGAPSGSGKRRSDAVECGVFAVVGWPSHDRKSARPASEGT
jgi:ArsR family transcriptional regulator